METAGDRQPNRGLSGAAQLTIVFAVVLLLRIPFLHQAIQGDDVFYLYGAEHAQIEPLHPNHAHYVSLGDLVDMRGHPHPPFNMWFLGALLAVAGDIREARFHAAYILFSLIAALAMWSLARRFSPHPLWAVLLFLATPAFVVNGSSLESDLPFLAFWMASIALFAGRRYGWSALAMVAASLAAYQAIFLTPILALYVWLYDRHSRAAWAATLVAPVTLVAWQIFERVSTGAVPATILAGYLQTYGWQSVANKLRSAAALSGHAVWLVFPLLLPPAFLASRKRRDPDTLFLTGWIALFFAGALVIFFAGSARYLLPMAAPVALLVSRIRPRWLAAGFVCQMALSLALAVVNYQHWDGYRKFAESLGSYPRVWINGEWGLRYYLESRGGLPMQNQQAVRPGDVVVTSELSYQAHYTTGGAALTPISQREIRPRLPFRLIGLDSPSAYSTISRGLRPFDISRGPIDRIRAELVVERQPSLAYLPMNAPEAAQQIVSGLYGLDGATWRWMGARAVVLVKSPAEPTPLRAVFTIPPMAPARRVTLSIDGQEVASQTYAAPGSYTLEAPPRAIATPTVTVTIAIDKAFTVPTDTRELGIIVNELGFRK
ncbi:MAG: hypothetical protein HYX25_08995 [Candidatus Solibacter usitatus]|nr:hypothetical protein [Candidatus Solibacter usitatus]